MPSSSTQSNERDAARVETERDATGRIRLRFEGPLTADTAGAVWQKATRAALDGRSRGLLIDVARVPYCDGTGASLLMTLRELAARDGGTVEYHGLGSETLELVDLITPSRHAGSAAARREGFFEQLGRASLETAAGVRALVAFVGELAIVLVGTLLHPRRIRFGDFVRVAERAGLGALPIILLVGFLLGLILAFQSVIPMQRFGAQVFVADFLGIAMFRELGPLMAAILLTARSGSAFAAELGTMKVNEEIDALRTLGLEPVAFLVVPRVLAGILVVPTLTMLTSLAGLAGGLVVFLTLGFPPITYLNRVVEATSLGDLLGGLVKSLVLGLIVAGVGCLRGLQAGKGASAVGDATTSAVVSGIILIAMAEGVFAVLFYVMGW